MSNFAKGNNSENAKGNNRKNKITFFLNLHQVIYSLSSISYSSLFKAPSCKSIWDIKFSMFKFAKDFILIFTR